MCIILDPKTGDVWDFTDGVWKKVREGMRLQPKLPRFVNGHIPTHCANPDCAEAFDGTAFRGERTGKLYCSRHCRDEMSDFLTAEDKARMQ